VTVNIGLVTTEALVLGCDSVASTSAQYIDPFSIQWEKDASGAPLIDKSGKFTLHFSYTDFQSVVTNAWGGVTKMFEIHSQPSPVVAITAGLAKLKDRAIANHASEFLAKYSARAQKLVSAKTICEHFLRFMRGRYVSHYRGSPLPPEFREGPQFLVGGYGRDDPFPSLYRLNVQKNTIEAAFTDGKTGIAWDGQSDAVERFVRGFDVRLFFYTEMETQRVLKAHNERMKDAVAKLVNTVLDKLQQPMPSGIDTKLPELLSIPLNWPQFALPVDYANLPLQEAVSFVSSLVMSQSSKARFARGVPTVGGRTHIGVITKDAGFRPLNEPTLAHRYTGFGDDL